MKHETPRTPDGAKLCAWCGGPIKQSGVGRSKDYCGRTHRELAYRERATQKRIAQALADASPVSSTDEVPGQRDSSTDENRLAAETSVDETVWDRIHRPMSAELHAKLDALADDPVDPDPVPADPPAAERPAPPPPPRRARRRSNMTLSPMPLWQDET
ncbi:hypothetical protein [Streptomyces niveus]|uniref:hypothetical protein n=1 Tax=Streptomyces niveus TaxID=193462 RepID=UPI00344CEB9D